MAEVIDVAAYILQLTGRVSTMKLQKLAYYCQALHLVRYSTPLFPNHIEAWANGPVSPALFSLHRHRFLIDADAFPGRGGHNLRTNEQTTIERVVEVLGDRTGEYLINLTHSEAPWKDARAGLAPGERSHNVISTKAIRSFYSQPCCVNPLFT